METVSDLARLKDSHPMLDAVIDEQIGRKIRIGDQWLADFASCNYLGFDLDEEIIDVDPGVPREVGHAPELVAAARQPAALRGDRGGDDRAPRVRGRPALPTITHIHISVIPVLAGEGTIFLDGRAHKTIYDGCSYARGHGATMKRFRHDDVEHLSELLAAVRSVAAARDRDGRRELHDRQRARVAALRRPRP